MLAAVGLGHQPLVILAKTLKGAGVSFLQDKEGWHGKAALEGGSRAGDRGTAAHRQIRHRPCPSPRRLNCPRRRTRRPPAIPPLAYKLGDMVATREAFGNALLRIGAVDPRVVAMDGDTKNSTFSEKFAKKFPDRFTECFIAEQCMVGVATGFGARGKVPFASTFACFFTRAYDQIRVAGISMANLKLVGSHVGVSIGEDGPSQMGLEDLAMMRAIAGSTVLYASDAVCAEKLVEQMAAHKGICFLRTSRPKTAVHLQQRRGVPHRRRQGAAPVRRGQGHGRGGGGDALRGVKGRRRVEGRGHRHHGH